MPAITLSNLHYVTPDAQPLFTGLDLGFAAERTGLVGLNGVGKTTLLRLITGELEPQAGSVSVSGTLAALRQSVQPAESETIADLFGVRDALALLARAEAGAATIDALAEADWMLESRIEAALGRVGLAATPDTPLAGLSGGQRTRRARGGDPGRARFPVARRADEQSRPRGPRGGAGARLRLARWADRRQPRPRTA